MVLHRHFCTRTIINRGRRVAHIYSEYSLHRRERVTKKLGNLFGSILYLIGSRSRPCFVLGGYFLTIYVNIERVSLKFGSFSFNRLELSARLGNINTAETLFLVMFMFLVMFSGVGKLCWKTLARSER